MEREEFSFSQNILSQTSTQMPTLSQLSTQMPHSSADNTWYSGDSQSLIQPTHIAARVDQIVPQVLAAAEAAKKTKYTAPKWTKGLLKSSDDAAKLKMNDEILRNLSEDLKYVKNQLFQIQQHNQNFFVTNTVKESTDFLIKNIRKEMDGLNNRVKELEEKCINDYAKLNEKLMESLKKQNQEGLFDILSTIADLRENLVAKDILVMGQDHSNDQVKYIHGNVGKGTFTFLGGHDPEDYKHYVGDPPTDLSLHKNSPGYRLILNNVLFPAAKKKKKKT